MAIVFDGKKFALEKEISLAIRVLGLKTRGVYPKLASILVGNDPASQLYVNLKKKAAVRIGAEVDIYLIKEKSKLEDLILLINTLNEDESVQGIMIQMPIPGDLGKMKDEIVNTIKPEKDVDGLRDDSPFLHPTSKAVIQVIDEAKKDITLKNNIVTVVGSTGMVGKPLVRELRAQNYEVIECNSKTLGLKEKTLQANILISVTGVQNLIEEDMVSFGAIVIDVGSPKGDVEFAGVSKKAGFISPVPGGVGPITISCLLENLLSAC
jgi:methylenetetrahydrofolate dehydrogenase (NADP+) / methenyltetrahydrofolate cyclohydrolase